MTRILLFASLAAGLLIGCGEDRKVAEEPTARQEPSAAVPAPAPEPGAHVVEIRAVGKTFEGPAEIPAGWTTSVTGNEVRITPSPTACTGVPIGAA